MLVLIVSPHKEARIKVRTTFFAEHDIAELVRVDDSVSSLEDLQQYIYPSLFSEVTPIISGLFLLQDAEWNEKNILQLVASPTMFVLEELSLKAPDKKAFEKMGAIILLHDEGKNEKKKFISPLFGFAHGICVGDKKSRWIALTEALATESAEVLIGMVYWKLRQLVATDKKSDEYKKMYTKLMQAQRYAWQKGIPLALELEKAILQN